jgi:hypothetical protein
MPHFRELRCAFNALNDYLSNEGEPLQAARIQGIYDDRFPEEAFSTTRHKSKPQYSDETYPSLFKSITVLADGNAVSVDGLPQIAASWAALNRQIQTNSLARVLLGIIWKQGDLNVLKHVFSGLRGEPLNGGDRVVMYQFGRHLADPLKQPIFDQHTYRACRLLDGFHSWTNLEGFAKLFKGKNAIPKKDRLPTGALEHYLVWWNEQIGGRLPAGLQEKLAAISAVDRLLFSLGKAAKLQINA